MALVFILPQQIAFFHQDTLQIAQLRFGHICLSISHCNPVFVLSQLPLCRLCPLLRILDLMFCYSQPIAELLASILVLILLLYHLLSQHLIELLSCMQLVVCRSQLALQLGHLRLEMYRLFLCSLQPARQLLQDVILRLQSPGLFFDLTIYSALGLAHLLF